MFKRNNPTLITEQIWPDGTNPVISVFNWTYNHNKFIRNSIESVLSQKTNFPVQIIIHDDASNDGTKEIVLEYQTKYPHLFRNILHLNNQWSKGKSVMSPLFEQTKGHYIALTHGDDYWTDPFKLQKQVDFLEANPEYVVSFHDYIQIDDQNNIIGESAFDFNKSLQRDFEKDELMKTDAYLPTLTMCFRNIFISNNIKYPEKAPNGDIVIMSILGEFGKAKFQPEIAKGVYRVHNGGVYSGLNEIERLIHRQKTMRALIKYHSKKSFFVRDELIKKSANISKQTFYLATKYRDKKYISKAGLNYLFYGKSYIDTKEIINIVKTIFSVKLKRNLSYPK